MASLVSGFWPPTSAKAVSRTLGDVMKKLFACSVLAFGSIVSIHAQNPNPPAVSWLARGAAGAPLIAPLEAKTVTGQPYAAEVQSESIQTLSDGNRIVQRSTGRVYRDSQGRVRREEDRPSGSPSISIFDPTKGVTYTLDPGSRTARQTASMAAVRLDAAAGNLKQVVSELQAKLDDLKRSGQDAARAAADEERRTKVGVIVGSGRATGWAANSSEETATEKLPDRMIEGVWATGIRRTTTIAKGAIGNEQPIKTVSEEWTSPDLQVLVLTDRNDPRSGRSTYKLLRVNLGEPDPSLFQVPPDYTIQQPGLRGAGGRGAPGVGK
jgi:hypothetical protein